MATKTRTSCSLCGPTRTLPTETRTYRVLFEREDGDSLLLLVDGHDMDDAMSFQGVRGARAVHAVEIPGGARPLGRR